VSRVQFKKSIAGVVLLAGLGFASTGVEAQLRPVPLRPPSGSVGGTAILPGSGSNALNFDPKRLGENRDGSEEGGTAEASANPASSHVNEIIEFKSNNLAIGKCRKIPLDTMINIDFQDAPLEDLTKWISCVTEKNFIIASGVGKGKKITIMSPRSVTVYEAYRAFLASLEINGLTLVPSGKFMKIQDIAKAKSDTLEIFKDGRAVPMEERFVTRLVALEHIAAEELVGTLEKFKTSAGDISIYGPTNTLIITDTGANIHRLLDLLDELDVPTGKERVWIRPIEHAEATELVDKLQEVFADSGKAAKTTASRSKSGRKRGKKASAPVTTTDRSDGVVTVSKILADERTNQLIVVSNRSSYLKLDRLIRKLDVPIPGEGQIHIHYLENADAEEISNTLSALTQSGSGSRGRNTSTGSRGKKKSSSKGNKSGGSAALFSGEVKISPHEETNSLVIEASLKDYLSLKEVIQKLDIRRKQVYVEAVIMEITSTQGHNLGVSGSAGAILEIDGEEVPLLLGAGGLGISGFDLNQLTDGGLAVGLQGPTVDVDPGSAARLGGGALSVPTFGFMLQALSSTSDVNILSTPHILTTDNEEAEIQVGKQIPYRSSGGGLGGLGALSGLGGLGGAAAGASSALGGLGGLGGLGALAGIGQVQYIDVDLTLKFTPHVNESNFVRLEIEQELEDVESLDPTLGPTTSRRRVTNTVVVKDGQPVVIGGLIRDSETEGVNKIPFLGDIPVIGQLFRTTVRQVEKKNLLMIIIPTIINDPSDLKRLHQQRLEEMRQFADALATRKKEYSGEVDYRKKSGALERMVQTVERRRQERELLENTWFDESEMDFIGPPETHDIEYDPYATEKGDERPAPVRVLPLSSDKEEKPAVAPVEESAPEAGDAPDDTESADDAELTE
jgi:general secretion pathway protein D